MERMIKINERKYNSRNGNHKTKSNSSPFSKEKITAKKTMLQQLIHPDYVLFDWEFFSNQLEFE